MNPSMRSQLTEEELRFKRIFQLLNVDYPSPEHFRKEMLAAYGIEPDLSNIDSKEQARMEEDFAKNCLSGNGSDANQMVQIHGDLRTVLAIEIGIITPEMRNGKDFVRRQWFGGDWIEMAKLIIRNSENARAGRGESEWQRMEKKPAQLLKLWPVSMGDDDVVVERFKYSSRVVLNLKYKIIVDNNLEDSQDTLRLYHNREMNPDMRELEEHKWILLPNSPSNMGDGSSSIVTENVWITYAEFFEGVE